jgi:DNA-binding NarL/FixJ family response regulator
MVDHVLAPIPAAIHEPPLSPREREVLQLLAEGHSSKTIAARLEISVSTVETHRRQIMAKLDIHTVAELTKYAIREGLSSLE